MKNFIVGIFALTILALGSGCEVYEITNTTDTIYVDRPIQGIVPTVITRIDTVVLRDTVSVNVIITEVDTVYKVVTRDSVIIKEVKLTEYDTIFITLYDTIINNIHHYDTIRKTVTLYDTIYVYDRTVVYLDSFVVVSYMRPTYYVPDEIQPFIEEFYSLVHQYGRTTQGSGSIIVQFVSDLPGENWTSTSFEVSENSQQVIQLDEKIPAALHRAGIFRELSRLQLGEKYTNIPDRVMNPTFSPETIVTKSHLDILFK